MDQALDAYSVESDRVLVVTIRERNRMVLDAIRKQTRAGKQRIGVFYGASHMPGIERALRTELGFRKTGERWLVSWDARKESRVQG